MIKNFKILITVFLILLFFVFLSSVLLNKSEVEKQSQEFNEGRIVDNIDIQIIDEKSKDLKKSKLFNYLQKDKTNIIHFWASWCSTCIKENELLKEYKSTNNINLISVILKDDISVIDFNKINNLYNVNINDEKGFIALEFGVSGVPENFIVDHVGKIKKHIVGSIVKGELE